MRGVLLGIGAGDAVLGCRRDSLLGFRCGGVVGVSARTRAEVHPEQFTYRPERKAPSLRRGWILGRSRGGEVGGGPGTSSPSRDERPENETDRAEEGNSPRARPRAATTGEGEEFLIDADWTSAEIAGEGLRFDSLRRANAEQCNGRPFVAKPKYVRGPAVDRSSFTRVYYLSALQVPAAESWGLASGLRQHLLNWPRVSNIGRVAGDDVDEELSHLYATPPKSNGTAAAGAAWLHGAVYEESSVESSKASGGRATDNKKRKGGKPKIPSVMIELVASDSEVEGLDSSVPGTAPEAFLPGKWRGPTRLLLLDEEFAGKKASELPMALQVALSRLEHPPATSASGLVNCRLTLFYEYWSLSEVLGELLPTEAHKPVEFERTGHVAELKLHPEHLAFRHVIAQVTLEKHEPLVRSVVMVKRDVLCKSQYATQIELLAGSSCLITTAWEHGVPFRVDLSSVRWAIDSVRGRTELEGEIEKNFVGWKAHIPYGPSLTVWDSRLGSERKRLVENFSSHDIVCDICAGVGLVAIPASRRTVRVYANEPNPAAYVCLSKNMVENKVGGRMEIFNEDIRTFLRAVFHWERPLPITQVVMNHPFEAAEFFGIFCGLFNQATWPHYSLPRIHVYSISRAPNPEQDLSKQVATLMSASGNEISTHKVVEVSAGAWMVCTSFILPAHFGFRDNSCQIISLSVGELC